MRTLYFLTGALFLTLCVVFLAYTDIYSPEYALAPTETQQQQGRTFCFSLFSKGINGLEDAYLLSFALQGDNVSGELSMLPAEKDSKQGKFYGTVSPVDPMAMARTIDALWYARAEGAENIEELRIIFGEGTASVGTGPMTLREDGVYAYVSKDALSYEMSFADTECRVLEERERAVAYLREHIATLVEIQPVLGGTWYVVSYDIDVYNKKGTVVFEDGHIQGTGEFEYTVDSDGEIESMVIKRQTL